MHKQINCEREVHIHIYMFLQVYSTYAHIDIHTTDVLTYTHACIHTYIHACIHTYIHTYIHACIHTYIRTNIHAYIQARKHVIPVLAASTESTNHDDNTRYLSLSSKPKPHPKPLNPTLSPLSLKPKALNPLSSQTPKPLNPKPINP